MKKGMTIAGSDSGGGAGIQADLKTFSAFGIFGTTAITALTAQNSIGVQGVYEIPADFVYEQIKSIMSDIGSDAAKTGMLASEAIVKRVAQAVQEFEIPNLVVDPVMVAKSGDPLLAESAGRALKDNLLPLARVITPNLYEAELLMNITINSIEEMKEAAVELKKTGCGWVVLKGGHLENDSAATDILYDGKEIHLLATERYHTKNTHGTGCTFASAIAAGLAKGMNPLKAIQNAKEYVSEAIRTGLALGKGHGPTNHLTGTDSRWR